MAKPKKVSLEFTEAAQSLLVWAMRFLDGGVDEPADKKRQNRDVLFQKAIDDHFPAGTETRTQLVTAPADKSGGRTHPVLRPESRAD
jgi:hypothetical protein